MVINYLDQEAIKGKNQYFWLVQRPEAKTFLRVELMLAIF